MQWTGLKRRLSALTNRSWIPHYICSYGIDLSRLFAPALHWMIRKKCVVLHGEGRSRVCQNVEYLTANKVFVAAFVGYMAGRVCVSVCRRRRKLNFCQPSFH